MTQPTSSLAAVLFAWALPFAIGCGGVSSETSDGGELDAAASIDGPVAEIDSALPDASLGEWAPPTLVDNLSHEDGDFKPSATADLLEMYFFSSRDGTTDIWMSERDDVDSAWETPVKVEELSTGAADRDPFVSADGRTMWFVSNRAGGAGQLDIWVSVRASRDDPWGTPTNLDELNTEFNDRGPMVISSELEMVFSSDRTGSMGCPDACSYDLYRASRGSAGGTWGDIAAITEVNTVDYQSGPWISEELLSLYFFSNHSDGENSEIYRAVRDDTGASFETAMPVSELNTEFSESDPWLSSNHRYLLFTSQRSGNSEIYESSR